MPTTVAEAFAAAGLSPGGKIPWGTKPATPGSGVYIVSLTDSLDSLDTALPRAPLSLPTFERWLNVCPELTVDSARPTLDELMRRVAAFWLRDEVILYVGLATRSLSKRLDEYYRTSIGERAPHRGGYFLKLLSNLDSLWVHYAQCSDPAGAESAIIGRFCSNVSDKAKRDLKDPAHPFPFANLEWPTGAQKIRKAHRLASATEPRVRSPMSKAPAVTLTSGADDVVPSPTPIDQATPPSQGERGSYRTQRVTPKDRELGQIRIPRIGKSLFPASRSTVNVVLRGQLLKAIIWDPQMRRDKERSGILRVEKAILRDLICDDEVLTVTALDDYTISIE